MSAEPLSAYVRRTRGDCDGCGPDWLADRIAELEANVVSNAKQHVHKWGPWENDIAGAVRECWCGEIDLRPEG